MPCFPLLFWVSCWAARLILRRPGSVGCLPHSLSPCRTSALFAVKVRYSPTAGRWWPPRRAEPQNAGGGERLASSPLPLPSRLPIGSQLLVSMVTALDWWAGPAGRVRPICGLTPIVPSSHLLPRGAEAGGLQRITPTSAPAQDR